MLHPTADDIKATVLQDLTGHTRICPPDLFLSNILPPIDPELVDQIHGRLAKNGTYSRTTWKGLPKKPGTAETRYYHSLACALNAIVNQATSLQPASPLQLCWVDKHSKVPISTQDHKPVIRPDLTCLMMAQSDCPELSAAPQRQSRAKNGDAGKGRVDCDIPPPPQQAQAPKTRSGKRSKPGDNQEDLEIPERIEPSLAFWIRTLAVFEVKPHRCNGRTLDTDTIIQLASYMRQMLREQHDRRFVFGCILCHDEVYVWYCDRSGLLGTVEPMDMHKEPKKFIQVIAALALATPAQLGWDLTMKLGLLQPSGQGLPTRFEHSWASIHLSQLPKGPDDVHWRIEIDGHVFLTLKALSVSQAEIMSGRASVTWLAIPFQNERPSGKPVVIKQSWPPLSAPNEAMMYDVVGDSPFLAKVVAHALVPDTNTLDTFRKGVMGKSFQFLGPLRRKTKGKNEQPFENDVSGEGQTMPARTFIPRRQERIVLDTYGWPLKYFSNLKELLSTLQSALLGYEELFRKGICHRDITPSNIIIGAEDRQGILIDLDHGKMGDSEETVADIIKDQATLYHQLALGVLGFFRQTEDVRNPDMSLAIIFVFSTHTKNTRADTITTACPHLPDAVIVFAEHLELMRALSKPENLDEDVTLAEFSISLETHYPWGFLERIASDAFVTGSIGFASYHLLSARFPGMPHTAIHDLESFFWVVLWICLVRSGSSANDSLSPNQDKEEEKRRHQMVSRLLYLFYEGPESTIVDNKSYLFGRGEQDLKTYIFPYLANFSQPLQELLLEWYRLLRNAYKATGPSIVYVFPIGLFKAALDKVVSASLNLSAPLPATQDITKKRQVLSSLVKQFAAPESSAEAIIPAEELKMLSLDNARGEGPGLGATASGTKPYFEAMEDKGEEGEEGQGQPSKRHQAG